MKYLLIILISLGAYYYFNASNINESAKALTYNELITKIESLDVKASEILFVSNKLAILACSEQEWLDIRGVSSQQCMAKLNTLKDACAERIFPDPNKLYTDKNGASQLLERYSVCVGV